MKNQLLLSTMLLFFGLSFFPQTSIGAGQDFDSLISEELTTAPLKSREIPAGPVRSMTTYNYCKNKDCLNKKHPATYIFDTQKRIITYERSDGSVGNYIFQGDRKYAYRIEGTRFGKPHVSNYTIDNHGNILASDGRKNDIEQTENGFVIYADMRKYNNGQRWQYYKNGLITRELHLGAKAIAGNQISKQETIYKYELDDNGNLSFETRLHSVDEKLMRKSWQKYAENGMLLRSYQSNWGEPDYGSGSQLLNYEYDKRGNWISRKVCEVKGSWDNFGNCRYNLRQIQYH